MTPVAWMVFRKGVVWSGWAGDIGRSQRRGHVAVRKQGKKSRVMKAKKEKGEAKKERVSAARIG